jgi:hypothetical protein
MDETSGTTMIDSSRHGHHGVLSGVALAQPAQPGYGFSYGFNGKSSKATVRESDALDPRNSNFEIRLAIKVPPTGTGATPSENVLQKGKSTTPGGHYKIEICVAPRTMAGQAAPSAALPRTSSSRAVQASRTETGIG